MTQCLLYAIKLIFIVSEFDVETIMWIHSVQCAVPPFDPMKKLNLDFNMWHSVGPIKTTANQVRNLCIYLHNFNFRKNLTIKIHITYGISKPSKTIQIEDAVMHRAHSEQFLAEKVKLVCELFPRLKSEDKETLSEKLVAMSSSSEICSVMRQSGKHKQSNKFFRIYSAVLACFFWISCSLLQIFITSFIN